MIVQMVDSRREPLGLRLASWNSPLSTSRKPFVIRVIALETMPSLYAAYVAKCHPLKLTGEIRPKDEWLRWEGVIPALAPLCVTIRQVRSPSTRTPTSLGYT